MAIECFTLMTNGFERVLMLSTVTSVGTIGAVANYFGGISAVFFWGDSANIVNTRSLNARLSLFPQAEQPPPSFPKV